ncbi:hypothetical protein QA601_11970 [Chitinispirillales bacterium ANBcel5]|uniref:hypothetical protein n=1 Tax=Cellulosispirillum alkaliphilum TaxID=3039283 RepID=UPI002A511301|nr:hypothetical protein [Chitinispirillales bacterium ANBcel5]
MVKVLVVIITFAWSKGYSDPIPINAFLSTVRNDYNLESQKEGISFLESSPVRASILDNVEFRIDDRALFSDQKSFPERLRYSLRLRPTGIRNAFAARQVHNTLLDYNVHRKKIVVNQLLKERYMLIFELLYQRARLENYLRLSDLYQDRIRILKRKINYIDFDYNALIKSEREYTDVQLSIVEQRSKIELIENKIRNLFPGAIQIEFDTTNIVSIETVYEMMSGSSIHIDSTNMYLMESRLKLRSEENRYRYESGSNKPHIRFIEFTFAQDHFHDQLDNRRADQTYDFSNAFQLEVGLSFPTGGPNRLTENRRKMALISERNRYGEIKKALEDRVSDLKADVKSLLAQYTILTRRNEEIAAESSLRHFTRFEGENPIYLLQIKESIIKNEIQVENLKYRIFKMFIETMDLTGKLSEKPLRNVISVNQELIP